MFIFLSENAQCLIIYYVDLCIMWRTSLLVDVLSVDAVADPGFDLARGVVFVSGYLKVLTVEVQVECPPPHLEPLVRY